MQKDQPLQHALGAFGPGADILGPMAPRSSGGAAPDTDTSKSQSRLPVSNFQILFSIFRLLVSNFQIPDSIFQLPVSNFKIMVSSFQLLVSNFPM